MTILLLAKSYHYLQLTDNAAEWKILNAVGMVCRSGAIADGQQQASIDISNLPAGAYLLNITTEDSTTTKRWTKQ